MNPNSSPSSPNTGITGSRYLPTNAPGEIDAGLNTAHLASIRTCAVSNAGRLRNVVLTVLMIVGAVYGFSLIDPTPTKPEPPTILGAKNRIENRMFWKSICDFGPTDSEQKLVCKRGY